MPQIFKRDSSPYFYARYQVGGKDYLVSTKKTNRNEAQEELKRLLGETKGTLSAEELLESLLKVFAQEEKAADTQQRKAEVASKRHEMARRLMGGQQEKVSIADSWQAWLMNPKKRNPGEGTIYTYQSQWERFKGWAIGQGIQYLHEVTPAHVEDYAASLWGDGLTPRTYNAHITFLKSLFKVLTAKAGLVVNVWAELPLLPKEQESRRNFTPEELVKVCKTATGSFRYMIGLGLYTGMRLGDVVNLRWDEVNLKEGFIEHIPGKTKRLKKKIKLPLHPVLESLLKALRATSKDEFLFPAERAQYQADKAALSKRIQQLFVDCGIKTTEDVSEIEHRQRAIVRVGFHSLRHSFVSLCAANRVPQVAIMELVGHGSPAMTRLYSHAGEEQKAAAIAALPAMKFGKRKE